MVTGTSPIFPCRLRPLRDRGSDQWVSVCVPVVSRTGWNFAPNAPRRARTTGSRHRSAGASEAPHRGHRVAPGGWTVPQEWQVGDGGMGWFSDNADSITDASSYLFAYRQYWCRTRHGRGATRPSPPGPLDPSRESSIAQG